METYDETENIRVSEMNKIFETYKDYIIYRDSSLLIVGTIDNYILFKDYNIIYYNEENHLRYVIKKFTDNLSNAKDIRFKKLFFILKEFIPDLRMSEYNRSIIPYKCYGHHIEIPLHNMFNDENTDDDIITYMCRVINILSKHDIEFNEITDCFITKYMSFHFDEITYNFICVIIPEFNTTSNIKITLDKSRALIISDGIRDNITDILSFNKHVISTRTNIVNAMSAIVSQNIIINKYGYGSHNGYIITVCETINIRDNITGETYDYSVDSVQDAIKRLIEPPTLLRQLKTMYPNHVQCDENTLIFGNKTMNIQFKLPILSSNVLDICIKFYDYIKDI